MTTKNIESILLVYIVLTIFFIICGLYSKTEIVPFLTAVMSMGYVIGTYYLIIRCKEAEETTNMEKMTTRQLIHNFYH